MENNIRLIKKINGLKLREIDCEHPIDNFHFIEYIDDEGNLKISFALYHFRGVYYGLFFKEFFKPYKIIECKKLSDYVKTDNQFISIQMAKYYKVQYAEDFITRTQFYKKLLERKNNNENNI